MGRVITGELSWGRLRNGPQAGAAEMSQLKLQPAICCVVSLDMCV